MGPESYGCMTCRTGSCVLHQISVHRTGVANLESRGQIDAGEAVAVVSAARWKRMREFVESVANDKETHAAECYGIHPCVHERAKDALE